MSILSIAGGAASQFLSSLTNKSQTSNSAASSSAIAGDSDPNISQFSRFLSKLEGLAQSDPAKFKQLTSQLASELKTATQQSGDSQSSFLNTLSDKLQRASETGSAKGLHPHHHHRQASGQSQAANAYASQSDSISPESQSIDSILQTLFNQVAQA